MKISIIKSMPDEELQTLINKHSTLSGILGELNLSKSCNHYRKILSERMSQLDQTQYLKNRQETNIYASFYKKYSQEERFCLNGKVEITSIRREYSILFPQSECAICSMKPLWEGKILNFHLDHINGINKDNRLENLRWICPNCHSQTVTYTGKNKNNVVRPGFDPDISSS